MEVELQFVYEGDGPLLVPVRLADLDLERAEGAVVFCKRGLTPEGKSCAKLAMDAINIRFPAESSRG